MTCRRCQCHLPDYAAFCPRCGSAVRRSRKGRKLLFLLAVGAVFMFAATASRVSTSSRHSLDIDPFSSVATPAPMSPSVRFVTPGQRMPSANPRDVVIEFDDRGMSSEQAAQMRKMLEESVRDRR